MDLVLTGVVSLCEKTHVSPPEADGKVLVSLPSSLKSASENPFASVVVKLKVPPVLLGRTSGTRVTKGT